MKEEKETEKTQKITERNKQNIQKFIANTEAPWIFSEHINQSKL